MNRLFNPQEKVELIFLHVGGLSLRDACAEFHARHPDKPLPNPEFLRYNLEKLKTTGSVCPKIRKRRKNVVTEENILLCNAENPHKSTYKIAQEVGCSQSKAWTTLQSNNFHPYKMKSVQELHDDDCDRRLEFCEWFLNKRRQQPNLEQHILFSDEATFYLNGMVNRQNYRYWSDINPCWAEERRRQNNPRVNVWCGIYNKKIIGPIFIEQNLNGERYLELLRNELELFIDELPLVERRLFYFQQDGAPPHFTRNVRDYLHDLLPERWIGRRGPVEWPARSPDLTPLDFFLWGFLKTKVYVTAPNSVDELKQSIRREINNITPNMLENVSNNIVKRIHYCRLQEGHQFEHLLKR